MKKLGLFFCLLCLGLSGCANGAAVGIGGGAGSSGAGGGIGLSLPLGEGSDQQSSGNATGEQGGADYLNSNLSGPYPDPNCNQPMKPDPGDSAGLYMIYQQQLEQYRVCIDTYAKNAKNDMMEIENKANNALREYRMFVTMP